MIFKAPLGLIELICNLLFLMILFPSAFFVGGEGASRERQRMNA